MSTSPSPARIVARALARSGLYHRRAALLAGLAALAVCGLSLWATDNVERGGLLVAATLLAVFTYRSIRAANRYFDKSASPVLAALAGPREHLVAARFEPAEPPPLGLALLGGRPARVVIEDDAGHRLPLRLPPDEVARVAARRLLDALAALVPNLRIEGLGGAE